MNPIKMMFIVMTSFLFFSTIAAVDLPVLAKDKAKSLADLDCMTNQVAKFNGEEWECAEDIIGGGIGGLSCRQVSNTVLILSDVLPGDAVVSVQCESGEVVFGGGCSNEIGNLAFNPRGRALFTSRPTQVDEETQGWLCATNPGGYGPEQDLLRSTAWAICCFAIR